MNSSFSSLLQTFLSDYIVNECNYSINTRKSYSTTFYLLLMFMKEKYHLSPEKVEFSDLCSECIVEFLDWLEKERESSLSTRNQRLAAIKSFFKHAQSKNPEILDISKHILDIKTKKNPDRIISYFKQDEIKMMIDYLSKKGNLKYLTLICVLYETGARVQELITIKTKDLTLSDKSSVILHGKGNKTRIVPISLELTKLISKYLKKEYKDYGGDFLFYSKNKRPYSRNGIYYIVDILVNELRELHSDKFKGNYHPHSFRHSIATHLYNNGISLLTIKEFLGHSTVMTTEIYATPDTDIMRKQILNNVQNIKAQSKYSYENKTDLENWLKENMK